MSKGNNKILIIVLLIFLSAFMFGVVRLFALRFEGGDVYPAYSSLRADPLGVKVFYEGLKNLPGLFVRRNYQPLFKLQDARDATVFYLGAENHDKNPIFLSFASISSSTISSSVDISHVIARFFLRPTLTPSGVSDVHNLPQ